MNAGRVLKQDASHTLLGYDDGPSCLLTNTEFAKLREVLARPPEERGYKQDSLPVPQLSSFTPHMKWIYTTIIGDAAAEELFGDGPWLQRHHTAKRKKRA